MITFQLGEILHFLAALISVSAKIIIDFLKSYPILQSNNPTKTHIRSKFVSTSSPGPPLKALERARPLCPVPVVPVVRPAADPEPCGYRRPSDGPPR